MRNFLAMTALRMPGRLSPASKAFLGIAAFLSVALPILYTAMAFANIQEDTKTARKNVLFIAVDDLRDWTGCLGGYPGVKTPNLDRLANRGLLFTRAYCSAPSCNPSRVALLCSVNPATSGVYLNSHPWRPRLAEAITLPQLFMQHGYKVWGGGKIFHGSFNDLKSWEVYFQRPADPVPDGRPLNGIPDAAQFDWGPLHVEDSAMGDAQLADWAVEFLTQEHDRPFFLAVGFIRPHLPWYVPRKYFEEYPLSGIKLPPVREDDLDDIPAAGVRMANPKGDHAKVLATDNWDRGIQGYLASITFCDGQIGRVLDALDRRKDRDDTIIVLWSDHGWHLGEKLHWRKFTLWEESGRVPLIFVVPGVTQPGSRCERVVSLLDVYPTLAELCNLPLPRHVEGRSLCRLLANPEAPWDHVALTTHGYRNHAVRNERWRYIRYADGSEELYDHQSDPHEWTNLASLPQYTEIKEQLSRYLPATDAQPAEAEKPIRAEQQGRRRAR